MEETGGNVLVGSEHFLKYQPTVRRCLDALKEDYFYNTCNMPPVGINLAKKLSFCRQ
jgi:hypothetical protein